MLKKILGTLLGAGMGWAGTTIRTLLAIAAGILVQKGLISADDAMALQDHAAAFLIGLLVAFGSYLNNQVMLAKDPNSK